MRQQKKSVNQLDRDEKIISEFMEARMVDDDGLIYAGINAQTLRPWEDEELASYDIFPGFRKQAHPAGCNTYEDSLMATSLYALSQMAKYEASSDPKALAAAVYQINAIMAVLREGAKVEKGYLPKPYGGLSRAACSEEISTDQYTLALVALRRFQRYSSNSQKKVIDDWLVAMMDYFLVRDFTYKYFTCSRLTPEIAPHGLAVFVPGLYIAHKITGDMKYKKALSGFDKKLDCLAASVENRSVAFNVCSLLTEGFALAREEGLQDRRLKKTIQNFWTYHARMVSSDGLGYVHPGVTDDHQCVPVLKKGPHPLGWEYLSWESNQKDSETLRLAALAPIVAGYFPKMEARKLGLFILGKVSEPQMMLHRIDPDGKQLLPQHRYLAETINGTSVASWLLGYWRLRRTGKMSL